MDQTGKINQWACVKVDMLSWLASPVLVPPKLALKGFDIPKPRDGKQKGSFTVSTNRAGSQKLTGMPIRINRGGGRGQMHIGAEAASGASGRLQPKRLIPAILTGKIHCQHTSVMGFRGLPVHDAPASVGRYRHRTEARIRLVLATFVFNRNFLDLHISS